MGAAASTQTGDLTDDEKKCIVQQLKAKYDEAVAAASDSGDASFGDIATMQQLQSEYERMSAEILAKRAKDYASPPKDAEGAESKADLSDASQSGASEGPVGEGGHQRSLSYGAELAAQTEDALKLLSQQAEVAAGHLAGAEQEDGAPAQYVPVRKGSFRFRRLTYATQTNPGENKKVEISSKLYASPEIGSRDSGPPPFPADILGTYSCHGIEPSYDADGIVEKINQDRGGVVYPFNNSQSEALFCVFDGHGEKGDTISGFCMNEIPRRLECHPDMATDPEKALKEVFVDVNEAMREDAEIEPLYSGTTAVVVYMKDRQMWVANVGDSRAVIATRSGADRTLEAVPLTRDHNPDVPAEKERILHMGGFVSPPPEEGLSARVWLDPEFTQIGLAMARSLGDHSVKQAGVIAEPEVTRHEICDDDAFFVLASDGVWEFIESQEAVEILAEHYDLSCLASCQELITVAASRWQDVEGDYRDDITAVVVKLPAPTTQMAPTG